MKNLTNEEFVNIKNKVKFKIAKVNISVNKSNKQNTVT